jgi:hypothetical protein
MLCTLQALAAASIQNVLESELPINQQSQLTNILQTATAIVVATKTYSPDRSERNRCRKLEEATFSAETAEVENALAALAAGFPAPKQLQDLQEQLQQRRAAAGTVNASPAEPGDVASRIAQQPAAADKDACCYSGLPLPALLLQAVVWFCDSRTAAAAAASCRQLRAAVAAQQFLQVPAALQLYLAALSEASKAPTTMSGEPTKEFAQAESAFVGQFPLDGSAAAGADLVS